ncbi:MAG: hypothetical protein D6820_17865 [Lentisphaerae bacterium]|nr:MAG: hypothetical protein D6820_17865 [Lentisphaerota bacterium]
MAGAVFFANTFRHRAGFTKQEDRKRSAKELRKAYEGIRCPPDTVEKQNHGSPPGEKATHELRSTALMSVQESHFTV